jgi:hypothetical protein
MRVCRVEKNRQHSQLEQGQVGVAVIGLVFALRHDVVLENSRRLGVVAVQSVQDGIDVLWPLGRVVEGDTHCCIVIGVGICDLVAVKILCVLLTTGRPAKTSPSFSALAGCRPLSWAINSHTSTTPSQLNISDDKV